jgi:glutamate-1-semialdehyde 2,1-aminomutase
LNGRDDIAAIIVEPTGASWGQVPILPDFLAFLREETAKRGIVLTFDEVISGFRVSPGGAQAHFGITPDLTTLAKIVAGGLPGGAIVGRQSIMDALDFAATQASGKEKIPHQGTFNANPVCAAAGIATLEIVSTTDACNQASDYAARLREELNRVLYDEKVPWAAYGTFSGFHIFTNPDHLQITLAEIAAGKYDYRVLKKVNRDLVTKLRLGMLIHGVEIFAWPGGPTSSVHTDDDLRQTVAAFRSTVRMLKEEGAV